MARDFLTVCQKIKEVAPNDFKEKLERDSGYWAPEICWLKLSQFVNKNMQPNSKDPVSVKIYAILCDVSESEMERRFIENGD